MSFADLPDFLIAHLTSYLEYEDVCNLMETSRKNYRAIKAYKKDKIKLESLYFPSHGVSSSSQLGLVKAKPITENGKIERTFSAERYYWCTPLAEKVENVLNECAEVEKIELFSNDLTSDLFRVLMETKVKIGNIYVRHGSMKLTVEEFVAFCKKFKGSRFENVLFNDEICRDEILIPVIKARTQIEIILKYWIERSFVLMTDKFLKATFGENHLPHYFNLNHIRTFFTIKEIVRSLEKIQNHVVHCHLGIFQSNQLNDADRYFNPIFGELKNEYALSKSNGENYKFYEIWVDYGLDKRPTVQFAVALH